MLKGHASPALLDSFTVERLPVVRAMLGESTKLLDKSLSAEERDRAAAWTHPPELSQLAVNYRWSPIVYDVEIAEEDKPAMAEGAEAYGHIDPNAALRAGDRAPDAPGLLDAEGQAYRIFDLINPARHAALVFATSVEAAAEGLDALATWPEDTVVSTVILPKCAKVEKSATSVLLIEEGYARYGYLGHRKMGDRAIVVIRPDGVVGAFVKDAAGVNEYRRRLLA